MSLTKAQRYSRKKFLARRRKEWRLYREAKSKLSFQDWLSKQSG